MLTATTIAVLDFSANLINSKAIFFKAEKRASIKRARIGFQDNEAVSINTPTMSDYWGFAFVWLSSVYAFSDRVRALKLTLALLGALGICFSS